MLRSQKELDEQFQRLFRADAEDKTDVILRSLLICITSGLLFWVSGALHLLVWGLVYLVMNVTYVWFLRSAARPVAPARFWISLCLSLLIALWVSHVPVFVAFVYPSLLGFLASCLAVGIGLHCIARNADFGLSAWVDLSSALLAGLGVTLAAAYHAPSQMAAIASLGGGICVIVYFVASLQQIIRDRQKLAQRIQEDMQNQKMNSLGQLTSGIAHDFNNLLTVIGGNIELARRDASAHNREQFLQEALTASQRAADLVRHLLAYARKSSLSAARHDLAGVLRDMERGILQFLPEHVSFRLHDLPFRVVANVDRAMLESAVLNLVINARDAMGAQGGEVGLTLEAREGQAMIHVDDRGPGMSANLLAKATDPFYTTKEAGKGSGLGLSMVQGFAEQSGGSLRLSNRAGGGLRATIALPLADAAETIAQARALA